MSSANGRETVYSIRPSVLRFMTTSPIRCFVKLKMIDRQAQCTCMVNVVLYQFWISSVRAEKASLRSAIARYSRESIDPDAFIAVIGLVGPKVGSTTVGLTIKPWRQWSKGYHTLLENISTETLAGTRKNNPYGNA